MKKQINPTIKAHLIRSAFYLLLLLGVCAIPFALAQRNATKHSAPQSTFQKPDSAANLPEGAPPYTKAMPAAKSQLPPLNGVASRTQAAGIPHVVPSQLPTTSNVGAAPPATNVRVIPPAIPAGDILYDQMDNPAPTPGGVTSQDFETANDPFDTFAADDFVVPGGETWSITGVDVAGEYGNGPGPAASFNVFFYADSATLPGTLVATRLANPYSNGANAVITLTSPVILTPGTYWVSVQARQDFTPAGQWFWDNRSVISNSGAAWQNPGGGFAVGCLTWGRKTTCLTTQNGPDQLFRLHGAICNPVSFTNSTTITIPSSGTATPYPSDIVVAGQGTVQHVTVTINGLTHTFPDDLDFLLVGPAGQNAIIWSDAGGSLDVNNVVVTLDDVAPNPLPDSAQIVSGTYQPANYGTGDTWPAPAPAPLGGSALSIFNGTDPNGTWSLYLIDDASGDLGMIAGGWTLTITSGCGPTATPTPTPTASPTPTCPIGDYTITTTSGTIVPGQRTLAITLTTASPPSPCLSRSPSTTRASPRSISAQTETCSLQSTRQRIHQRLPAYWHDERLARPILGRPVRCGHRGWPGCIHFNKWHRARPHLQYRVQGTVLLLRWTTDPRFRSASARGYAQFRDHIWRPDGQHRLGRYRRWAARHGLAFFAV